MDQEINNRLASIEAKLVEIGEFFTVINNNQKNNGNGCIQIILLTLILMAIQCR